MQKKPETEVLKNYIRQAVEARAGFKPVTSPDFDRLAREISAITKEYVSPTTLKRIWNYIEGWQRPRPGVLNLIAKYLGYPNAHQMELANGLTDTDVSGQIDAPHLLATKLPADARLQLSWQPDRSIIVRHLHDNLFVIDEVNNSRAAVGATFCCDIIIDGQPLVLNNYLTAGDEGQPLVYECGRRGGVKFQLL